MRSTLTATQIFLSTVSDDFEKVGAPFVGLRSRLRFYLNRAQGQKAVAQEEFLQVQEATLQKLDNLLRPCGTVIHLVGGKAGAKPSAAEVREYLDTHPGFLGNQPALRSAFGDLTDPSYTQWEALMALHYGLDLFIYSSPDAAAQQVHLDRLRLASPKKYASPFKDEADLLGQLIGDLNEQLPRLAEFTPGRPTLPQPNNLPCEPLGSLFIGRADEIAKIHAALHGGSHHASIRPIRACVAAYGLGGIGKTRLACEYAWQHKADYDALFFLDGSHSDGFDRSLTSLAAQLAHHIDLPVDAKDEERRAEVMRWLHAHPRCLFICDSIDDEAASVTIRERLPQLPDAHFIFTGRISRWWQNVVPLELGVLDREASAAFLLARSAQRMPFGDDAVLASELAEALGGLALLLEQAAAYLNDHGISFKEYLLRWHENKESCLTFWDSLQSTVPGGERPYGYSTFVTWKTTVERLAPDARLLLELCAFLASEPIPQWIMEHESTAEPIFVKLSGIPESTDTLSPASLRMLIRSGMVSSPFPCGGETAEPIFRIHRIVQEVTRIHLRINGRHD